MEQVIITRGGSLVVAAKILRPFILHDDVSLPGDLEKRLCVALRVGDNARGVKLLPVRLKNEIAKSLRAYTLRLDYSKERQLWEAVARVEKCARKDNRAATEKAIRRAEAAFLQVYESKDADSRSVLPTDLLGSVPWAVVDRWRVWLRLDDNLDHLAESLRAWLTRHRPQSGCYRPALRYDVLLAIRKDGFAMQRNVAGLALVEIMKKADSIDCKNPSRRLHRYSSRQWRQWLSELEVPQWERRVWRDDAFGFGYRQGLRIWRSSTGGGPIPKRQMWRMAASQLRRGDPSISNRRIAELLSQQYASTPRLRSSPNTIRKHISRSAV